MSDPKPQEGHFFSIFMQTPAATVLPMSRMANRASSGNALSPAACSMAMGLVGWNRTIASSPVLMKSGLASFPDLFVFSRSSWKRTATCAVWQWNTGV